METRSKILAAVAVIGLLTGLGVNLFYNQPEIDRIEDGKTTALISNPLNFQGQMNHTRLKNGNLVLDTRTVVETEKVAEGNSVAAVVDGKLYFTKNNGETYYLENGRQKKLEFDSTYGAVAGNFDYPGFNIIYANQDRQTYIRNIETGKEKKLYDQTVEVQKADVDGNGVPESAKIWLKNGTKIIRQPNSGSSGEEDWDGDGFVESLYIKQNSLYMYDRKHSHERMVNATSVAFDGVKIFIGYSGEIKRLRFSQELYDKGTYISQPEEFDQEVEVRQLITRIPSNSLLSSGRVTAEVIGENSTERFQLGTGLQSKKFRLETSEVRVKFILEKGGGKSPKIKSYELLHRGTIEK